MIVTKTKITVENTHLVKDAKRAKKVLTRLQQVCECETEISSSSVIKRVCDEK